MSGASEMLDVNDSDLEHARQVILAGGITAFPTETYYGLGVNPFDPAALEKLFALKNRPHDKPVLVLVEDRARLADLVSEVPPIFETLMATYWPGPLTLVFPARPELPHLLTGNTGTVGVRLSSHPVANRLVRAVGGAITATSANPSGGTACVRAAEVRAAFGPGIDWVLEGGPTPGGLGSTILACFGDVVWLVRDGAVPFAEVQKILAELAGE